MSLQGIHPADVIHTAPSSWVGWGGSEAVLCSSRACNGAQEPWSSEGLCFWKYLTHPEQHPTTNWFTRGRYPLQKLHSQHFKVARRSSKTIVLGYLSKINSTLCIKSTLHPFSCLVPFSFLLPGCHPVIKWLGDPCLPKGDKSWKNPIISL